MVLLAHTTHTLTPHDAWRIGTWRIGTWCMIRRIGWLRNGCGRIGQQFELTERGGIHVGSPGVATFGGWIRFEVAGAVVFAFDATCLRDPVPRPHLPHGFQCPSPLPANVRLPDGTRLPDPGRGGRQHT